jgi:hypothetical protein
MKSELDDLAGMPAAVAVPRPVQEGVAMSKFVPRRTAALLLAASLGLVSAADAHAAGSRTVAQTPSRQSVAIRLQEMVQGLWNGALGSLSFVTGADTAPGQGDKPPANPQARDGAGLDPHGGNDTPHP